MQKKSPLYVLLKEDTVWSMDRLNRHINDKFRKTKGLPRDWVFTTFTVCVLLPNTSLWEGAQGQDPLWSGRQGHWTQGAQTVLGAVSVLVCVKCVSACELLSMAAGLSNESPVTRPPHFFLPSLLLPPPLHSFPLLPPLIIYTT